MIPSNNQHKRDSYEGTFVRGGAVFVILGILSVIFELVALTYHSSFTEEETRHELSKLASGIWCGVFFIFAGCCSITAGRKITSFTIILAVIVVIISLLVGIAQLTIEILIARDNGNSKFSSSIAALHSVLATFAILQILVALVELYFFASTTFFTSMTPVPKRKPKENCTDSQTEVTRDVRSNYDTSKGRNGHVNVIVAYHNATNDSNRLRLESTAALITNDNSHAV